jgi:hypothetical protein
MDRRPVFPRPCRAGGVVDGRSRFREIYCAVTDERGPDILEAVAAYPELQQRVSAVVSLAGAVGGSPVGNTVEQSTLNLMQHLPGAECDPLIPGSVLLGYLNADHWAVAVPINRNPPFIPSHFVDKNAFPREVLAEAIVRFIEENLNHR